MRRSVATGDAVVVKIGSSSLSAASGGVDPKAIARVVDQVENLWGMGHPCVLVTSGAVSAGLGRCFQFACETSEFFAQESTIGAEVLPATRFRCVV